MFDTQVCLVSTQAAPNLLPLLDEQLKPREVILLVTEQMKDRARYLQKVITPLGIKVTQQTIEATGNFQQMQEQLESLIKNYPQGLVGLNVTGGTK